MCVYFSAISLVCDPSRNGMKLLGLLRVSPSLHVTVTRDPGCSVYSGFISVPSPAKELSYPVTFPRSFYIYTRS